MNKETKVHCEAEQVVLMDREGRKKERLQANESGV